MTRIEVRAISLDAYLGYGDEKALREYGVEFIRLGKGYRGPRLILERSPIRSAYVLTRIKHEMLSALRAWQPNVVIMGGDDNLPCGVCIRFCRELAVPTFLLVDGVIRKGRFSIHSDSDQKGKMAALKHGLRTVGRRVLSAFDLWGGRYVSLYGQGGCDRIATTGPLVKEQLIQEGVPAKHIVITGQPRFDAAYTHRQQFCCRDSVIRELNLNAEKGIVLFASTGFVPFKLCRLDEERAVYTAIAETAKSLTNTHQLVVKLHPRDDPRVCRDLLNSVGLGDVPMLKEVDLHRLLCASDLVLAGTSTVILEAAITDRPAIELFYPHRERDVKTSPYIGSGAVLQVTDMHDLPGVAQQALFDPMTRQRMCESRAALVHQLAFRTDRPASQVVAEQILDLAMEWGACDSVFAAEES